MAFRLGEVLEQGRSGSSRGLGEIIQSTCTLSVGPIPDRRGSTCTQGLHAATSRRAAAVSSEALGVSLGGAAVGADLGGSSKYSNENFED